MKSVYCKELKLQLCSFSGYVFLSAFLLIVGGTCILYNFIGGSSNFEYSIGLSSLALVLFVPVSTMRIFAEERRQNTDKLLYCLPLTMTEVVLGKYFALLTWMLVPLAVISTYPLILSQYGPVALISSYGSLIGFFFLICCLCAIGMFISALFESQITAAVVSFISFLALYMLPSFISGLSTSGMSSLISFSVVLLIFAGVIFFMTGNIILPAIVFLAAELPLAVAYWVDMRLLSGKFAFVLSAFCIFERFSIFTGGMFSMTGIVYFFSVAMLFLFFTVQVLEKRRWS